MKNFQYKIISIFILSILIMSSVMIGFSSGNSQTKNFKITKVSINNLKPFAFVVNNNFIYFACQNNITVIYAQNLSIINIVHIQNNLLNQLGSINLISYDNNSDSIIYGGTLNNNETILEYSLLNYSLIKILKFEGIPIYIDFNHNLLFSSYGNKNCIYYFNNDSLIKSFELFYNISSLNLSHPFYIGSIIFYENDTYMGIGGNQFIGKSEMFEIKNFNISKIKDFNSYLNVYSMIFNVNRTYLFINTGYPMIPTNLYIFKTFSFTITKNMTINSSLDMKSDMIIYQNDLILPGLSNLTFISLNNFSVIQVINFAPVSNSTLSLGYGWGYYPFEYDPVTNSFYIFCTLLNKVTNVTNDYLMIISITTPINMNEYNNFYLYYLIIVIILVAIIVIIYQKKKK